MQDDARSAFFYDPDRLPVSSIWFDNGVLMRGIPHEWAELGHIPEMAGLTNGQSRPRSPCQAEPDSPSKY